MITEDLIGLTGEEALAALREAGIGDVEVRRSAARPGEVRKGTERVIAISGDGRRLTLAVFVDPTREAPDTDGV